MRRMLITKVRKEEEEEEEVEVEKECLLVGCLTSQLVYLRDGSAQTILRAATLR